MRGLLLALMLIFGCAAAIAVPNPEARPYVDTENIADKLNSALATAAGKDKKVIVVLGANWCHDSRALAGWFATPRFAAMLREKYEVVFIDVGTPQTGLGRNLDVAKRFGIAKVKSTPLVMVLSSSGERLNSNKDAVGWRNAASRSEDTIFDYFESFSPTQK